MREAQLFGHEQFICFWETGEDSHVIEIHNADFFNHENGYTDSDIETLANTLIGESADLSAVTQVHYLLRIK